MISFLIGVFNIYIGYLLRDHDRPVARWLQALNYILGGSNLTVAVVQLVG